MLRFLKHISREGFKKEIRKFGINLMTASFVALFVEHIGSIWAGLSFVLFILGSFCLLFGLYKTEVTSNDDT
jgi:hypothetical protein